MRVDDIRHFVVVAECSSLVAAAQMLGMSQPTLSKSLARLERAVRTPLLERHSRGVRLTAFGRVFLTHARHIDVDVRDALAALRDLRHGTSGMVRFGAGMGIPHALVADACQPFLQAGNATVEITGGMSDSLVHAVVAGEADFAITGVRTPDSDALAWLPLFRDPMIAMAHINHPLRRSRATTWRALARERWIVANVGTITRAWFDRQFHDRGLTPPRCIAGLRGYPIAFELGLALGALMLVPACTPATVQDLQEHAAIPVPADWHSDRVVGILYRPGGYLSPGARRLMGEFQLAARRMYPQAIVA